MRLSLIPREKRFYDLLEDVAAVLVEAADEFAGLVEQFDETEQRTARLRDLEHRCDQAVASVLTTLARTFITPLDREDIHGLATSLDDVLDDMEEAAYRLSAYRIERPPEPAVKLALITREAVGLVHQAVRLCRDQLASDEMQTVLGGISRLENAADDVYRRAVADLFANSPNTLEVIKWQEIYHRLENTVDACRDVAHVISEIVVKGT